MRPDACGICLLKQTASGAQSVTSPSKIEGFREFEADLSALFHKTGCIRHMASAIIRDIRIAEVQIRTAVPIVQLNERENTI